jgi:hypothetical protein
VKGNLRSEVDDEDFLRTLKDADPFPAHLGLDHPLCTPQIGSYRRLSSRAAASVAVAAVAVGGLSLGWLAVRHFEGRPGGPPGGCVVVGAMVHAGEGSRCAAGKES